MNFSGEGQGAEVKVAPQQRSSPPAANCTGRHAGNAAAQAAVSRARRRLQQATTAGPGGTTSLVDGGEAIPGKRAGRVPSSATAMIRKGRSGASRP
jgi:hypothetical protein